MVGTSQDQERSSVIGGRQMERKIQRAGSDTHTHTHIYTHTHREKKYRKNDKE